jgi:hypothetical protein
MSDIWDGLDLKAREFRGALRIFSYACEVLTQECRRLCDPETTTGILDTMAERGDRDALGKSHSIDDLVNRLLSDLIELAQSRAAGTQRRIERIAQGCFFIGMLADLILRLPDKDLLTLASREVEQPDLDQLRKEPRKAIEESLGRLQPPLPEYPMLGRWDPKPEDPQP